MAWINTGGSIVDGEITGLDGIITSSGGYWDTRTDPDDEDATQVRPHSQIATEFRGLTLTHAVALSGASVTALKTVMRTATPIGGGGYIVTQTVDEILGGWVTLAE